MNDEHALDYATQLPSPNVGGDLVNPKYIVLHYTAGSSLSSSTAWLRTKQAKASAHLIIGKDAHVNQLVPMNRVAWHAGESSWNGLNGLNKYSLGVELDNRGPLLRSDDGLYRTIGGVEVDPDWVYVGRHKNGGSFGFWDKYTPEQLEMCVKVCRDLRARFPSIVSIIGHDDISPRRKWDPGPALPLEWIRTSVEVGSPTLVA